MKTLVVDDCPIIRATVSKHLKNWDFQPVLAADGKQALEILSAPNAPRLLIVDWMMPEMDGPELIQRLREQDPNRSSYIIMLTAKTGSNDLETAFDCGADDYLAKPIVEEELYRRVREGQNILERQNKMVETLDRLSKISNPI